MNFYSLKQKMQSNVRNNKLLAHKKNILFNLWQKWRQQHYINPVRISEINCKIYGISIP